MTHWPRARDQVAADARDLELRGRLEQEAAAWQTAPRREKAGRLRMHGLPLAEARALLARWGNALPAEVRDFIAASRRAAQRRRLRQIGSIDGGRSGGAGDRAGGLGGDGVVERARGRSRDEIRRHPRRLLRDGQPGDRGRALRQRGAGAPRLPQGLRSRTERGHAGRMAARDGLSRSRSLAVSAATISARSKT